MRKKILLLYPYYYPHYKAGGPVQSIYNLAGHFQHEAEFFFISLSRDIDHSVSEIPVCDGWKEGPQWEHVFYASSLSFALVLKLVREVKPDVIFVNGLFNAVTTLPGILLARWFGIKLVISPRGMLQKWALDQSRTSVKKIFIAFLKLVIRKSAVWHATDELERNDIRKYFGISQEVHIASNIPRSLVDFTPLKFPDENGTIRLVFLSLINPNKNLHLIIEAVNHFQGKFTLDIYGPLADQAYWKVCEQKIGVDNEWIYYQGPVVPWQVQGILKQYHFFVLPTTGENFGHAIFDALSCGVPVLISRTTPWQDIEDKNAGFYIDPLTLSSLIALLEKIVSMDSAEYQALKSESHLYATNYWAASSFRRDYHFLIGDN